MPTQPPLPYWIDDLREKHECYPYGGTDVRTIAVPHFGRNLRVVLPDHLPPFGIRVVGSAGNLLFLIGEQLDEKEEDRVVHEGGDGVLMVARKDRDQEDAYWVFIWHRLHTDALQFVGG